MQIIYKQSQLSTLMSQVRDQGLTVGFVPTMGALHAGHMALVERAKNENDIVVASIFVNPTQFNNLNDLKYYPRTPEADQQMLLNSKCDYLFTPEIDEMYPETTAPSNTAIDLAGLDQVMEGTHRPGHFAGVVQIVHKLFQTVGACRAYFGEKDFQQLAIIRKMTKELNLPIDIVACPTVREPDGLAMSSRNTRLSAEERLAAALIARTLFQAKELWANNSVQSIRDYVIASFKADPRFKLEYFEIADQETLQPITTNQKNNAIALIAVHLGPVRLIDNIILSKVLKIEQFKTMPNANHF